MLSRTSNGQTIATQGWLSTPNRSAAANQPIRSGAADVHALCKGLTARQRDVLSVMLQGKSNKAICRVLNLAEPTVKNHVTAILKALNVTNRTEAVLKVTKAPVTSISYAYTLLAYPAVGTI
jgi:DNA-binding NarL/FixJ family response regulator